MVCVAVIHRPAFCEIAPPELLNLEEEPPDPDLHWVPVAVATPDDLAGSSRWLRRRAQWAREHASRLDADADVLIRRFSELSNETAGAGHRTEFDPAIEVDNDQYIYYLIYCATAGAASDVQFVGVELGYTVP